MKKTLSIFGLLILFSSVVFGGVTADPSSTEVKVTQDGFTIKVFCKSESKSVKVSILTESGKVLFTETVRIKNGFVRPYNLKDLKVGKYLVSVEDEFGKTEKSIRLADAKSELLSAIVKFKDTKKCLATLAGKNNPRALITVRDTRDKVVYEESIYVGNQSVKLIDLSKFQGRVVVKVTGENGELNSRSID
jgi:hypothetical protein